MTLKILVNKSGETLIQKEEKAHNRTLRQIKLTDMKPLSYMQAASKNVQKQYIINDKYQTHTIQNYESSSIPVTDKKYQIVIFPLIFYILNTQYFMQEYEIQESAS